MRSIRLHTGVVAALLSMLSGAPFMAHAQTLAPAPVSADTTRIPARTWPHSSSGMR